MSCNLAQSSSRIDCRFTLRREPCTGKVVLFVLAGLFFANGVCWAVDPGWEVDFLAGLRARGLYRLAVRHAEGIIARDDISDSARIDLAIELSRTLNQWGFASLGAEREEQWRRAHGCLHDAAARLPMNPRRVLLEVQDALLWLSEGDLVKEEAAIAGSEQTMELARQKLRTVVGMLEKISAQVEEALRSQRMARSDLKGTKLTVNELTSLSQHIHLQSARALQSQAETYPADSPDRINSLTRAVDQLNFLLSRAAESDLRYQAELALIGCHRLLGHMDQAQRLLAAARSKPAFPPGALAAERVRLLLAAGSSGQAVEAARQDREKILADFPELMLAQLEAMVVHAVANDPSNQTDAIEQATQLLAEISSRHGPRWQRRGELWVARLLANTNQTANTVATARLAAEGLYRAGRHAEAVAAFDRAASLARREDDPGDAFDLELMAASIVRQGGNEQEAARRYLQLAASNPAHPRAAEAHRWGILATAAAARIASSPAERSDLLTSYLRLLEEHLERWSTGSTADEVRLWLGNWRLQASEHDGERDGLVGALGILQQVSPESEQFSASRRLVIEIYERQLNGMENGSEQADLANEAAHALQPVITGSDNQWPDKWTDLARDVALALARMQLTYVPDGAAYADTLLTAARAGDAGGSDPWQKRALGLQLTAKLALGQRQEAEAMMSELSAAPKGARLEVALWMGDVLEGNANSARVALSQAVLQLLDAKDVDLALGDEKSLRLAQTRARALAATHRRDEAVAAYHDLVAVSPGDPIVYEEYAALLAGGPSIDDHRDALRLYREMEKRTKPGGKRWTRARQARIGLFIRVGDREQARKLLGLTAAVYPELGGPDFRPQFEALARELGESL